MIVPAYPGITSAVGLLTTDLKYDAVRTVFQAGDRDRPRPAERATSRRCRTN